MLRFLVLGNAFRYKGFRKRISNVFHSARNYRDVSWIVFLRESSKPKKCKEPLWTIASPHLFASCLLFLDEMIPSAKCNDWCSDWLVVRYNFIIRKSASQRLKRKLKLENDPRTSRSHVTRALPSGLRFGFTLLRLDHSPEVNDLPQGSL